MQTNYKSFASNDTATYNLEAMLANGQGEPKNEVTARDGGPLVLSADCDAWERSVEHEAAEALGLKSQSTGDDSERRLRICNSTILRNMQKPMHNCTRCSWAFMKSEVSGEFYVSANLQLAMPCLVRAVTYTFTPYRQ